MIRARSGSGLRLVPSLIVLGACCVASSASASDLRLSITDTLFGEFRGDNQNKSDDDDNYGVFVNRLNLVASGGPFTASQRIDLVQFINAPTYDHVSEIIPERINLRYRIGDVRLMVGDFHRQLGRGIALAIRKVDELGLDVALRGGEFTWSGDSADISFFGGVTNSVNIDAVNQKHIEDPLDLIAGVSTDFSVTDTVQVGAYGLYMQPEEVVIEGETDRVGTGGGTVEVQLMDSDLVIYGEGVAQNREIGGRGNLGYAAYLSMDLALGDWTVLVESLFMEAFEQLGSYNTALGTNRFNYSNAPTLERFDQEVVNNKAVAGFRSLVETSLLDGDLRVHASMMYRVTDPLSQLARVDQLHGFAGAEYTWDYGDSRLASSAGYRRELDVDGEEVKTMIHADVDYQQRLSDAWSLQAKSVSEFRTLRGEPYERGSVFLGVDWTDIGGVTFEFGYDTQDQSEDARNFFYAGIAALQVTERIQLRATAGTQRGGLKCIAGVCRKFPEFTGGRVEAIARF